jgi:hypothetical protein
MSTTSNSTSNSAGTSDSESVEVQVTYQTFYPGQIVIAREFPEGSLRVSTAYIARRFSRKC